MMLITAAEERKKGMTALYIDGEYAVSVDSMTLQMSGKKTGSQITDEELNELLKQSKVNRAKEKALYLIEYRARSRREVEDRLVPAFGEEAAEAAIERLEELGLIDDAAYAERYAEQLFEKKHYAARRVMYELEKKGIVRELAEELTEKLEPDPAEQISHLLETKYVRSLKDEKGRQRAVNGLRAMGYEWRDIRDAMADYEQE